MNKLTKFSRAILAIAMMLTFCSQLFAENIEIGGIYYSTSESSKTATVISGTSKYVGEVVIPATITYNDIEYTVSSISSSAFSGCSSLSSLTIPNSISIISDGTFDDCTTLSNLIIKDGFSSLKLGKSKKKEWNGNSNTYNPLFKSCSLKYVYLGRSFTFDFNPGSAQSTADRYYGPFYYLGIEELVLGDYVTEIPNYAFGYNSSLKTIKLSNSLNQIGERAFYNCTGLTEVNISDLSAWCKIDFGNYDANPLYYAKEFKLNGIEIKDLVIPNDVTEIKDYVFYGCSGLTSVTIPNSVTSIGADAFYGCSGLTSVTLGNSVATIGSAAFSNCNKLQNVTSLNPMPQNIDASVFSSTAYSNATLTVPYNCSGVYAGRTGWGSFNNIVEMEMPKIYLTLKFPESGTITHKEVYEEAVDLSFKANEGWEINSVTFNEEDVTAELDEDGNYTTPVLMADAILVVVFEKIDTSIEPISEKNDIKVYANNGEVRIVGAEPQSEVSIYNSIGALVYKGYDKTIALNGNGVYILTIEGRTFKFAM